MKASKFTDAQKAFIIRQGVEGTPVEEICLYAAVRKWTSGAAAWCCCVAE